MNIMRETGESYRAWPDWSAPDSRIWIDARNEGTVSFRPMACVFSSIIAAYSSRTLTSRPTPRVRLPPPRLSSTADSLKVGTRPCCAVPVSQGLLLLPAKLHGVQRFWYGWMMLVASAFTAT